MVSPLHIAARKGMVDEVQRFLEQGANLNVQDEIGRTPLYLALTHNHKNVARLLIDGGADINVLNIWCESPLHEAADKGKLKIVKCIISLGYNINAQNIRGYTPLHLALINKHEIVARFLISKGAHVTLETNIAGTREKALHLAFQHCNFDMVIYIIKQGANINSNDLEWGTLLHQAVKKSNCIVVQAILSFGADINCKDLLGDTPLHKAVVIGLLDMTRTIIELGAELNTTNLDSKTPLIVAAASGNLSVVELLLSSGADVTPKDIFGNTALHYPVYLDPSGITKSMYEAAFAEISAQDDQQKAPLNVSEFVNLNIAKVLINYGANLDAKNKQSKTPIMVAIENRNIVAVQLLIRSGADVTIEDNFGSTPLHAAIELENWIAEDNSLYDIVDEVNLYIVKSLIDHGANVNARDMDSETPLHVAIKRWNLPAVLLLLRSGADVRMKDEYGNTILHDVALNYCSNFFAFRCIVNAGADIDARNKSLQTPLLLSISKDVGKSANYDKIPLFLIKRGVDVDVIDKSSNQSLVHIAAKNGYFSVLTALLESGAEVEKGIILLDLAKHLSNKHCATVLLEWGVPLDITYESTKYDHIKKCIKAHAHKLLCINRVKKEQLVWEGCTPFEMLCLKELAILKNIKHGLYSLYNTLLLKSNPNFANNILLEQEVTNGKERFPIYHPLLRVAFIKAKVRLQLLNYVEKCYSAMLPAQVKMKILSYLSNMDLKNILSTLREQNK